MICCQFTFVIILKRSSLIINFLKIETLIIDYAIAQLDRASSFTGNNSFQSEKVIKKECCRLIKSLSKKSST